MSRDEIVVMSRSDYGPYFLQWICEGEEGAEVGDYDEVVTEAKLQKEVENEDLFEFLKAEQVAASLKLDKPNQSRGYEFETVTTAKKALAIINAALKDKSTKPWPEWALKAQGAGWKPPKNWKP